MLTFERRFSTKSRVNFMKLVGVNVWAATSNNTINILNTQTRQSIYMIKNTPDAVTCIELVSVHKSPIASFPKSLL